MKTGIPEFCLGLDLGTVNVKLVVPDPVTSGAGLLLELSQPSRGNPQRVADQLLREAREALGFQARIKMALTGVAAPAISGYFGPSVVLVNEIVAAAAAVGEVLPEARTVIDLGGQFSKWILIDQSGQDSLGRVEDYALNGLCAAGSGAFLEQQATRLKMSLPELSELAENAALGATIAGRCSVFAKSDMIHLQQKGTPADEIAYGLCLALARTFAATVLEGREVEPPVALVGGGASNPGLVRALRSVFGLDDSKLVVSPGHHFACALGAALAAVDAHAMPFSKLVEAFSSQSQSVDVSRSVGSRHPPLPYVPSHAEADGIPLRFAGEEQATSGYLGVDVGSVSTNVVLLSPDLELLEEVYVPTQGRPVDALDEALSVVEKGFPDVRIIAVGATGSGRHLADRLLGADLVKNEITAQLVSALRYVPGVETVFEIGGQDSKFISVRGGKLRDFEMNKICAAGTGSFLEEQAERLGIAIVGEFAELARNGKAPVDLGSRCTVFMDTELCHAMERAAPVEDLCAGLAYSVARNYLEKVVAGREVGKMVVFQGGTSANDAVVAAFRQLLGRPVIVHPHGRVSGAIGAASIAAEEQPTDVSSKFRGFGACRDHSIRSFECKHCDNRCQVNRVDVQGRQAHFGDICERYTSLDSEPGSGTGRSRPRPFPELFAARATLLDQHLPKPGKPGRTRVGLVRASLSMEYLPFWAHLLDELGFEPVIAPGSPGLAMGRGQGLPSEVCLPLKLANYQLLHLLQVEKLERVLVPAVFELERHHGQDRPCTCIYAQHLADMANLAHGERILTPQLGISSNEGVQREAIKAMAASLGLSNRKVRVAWDQAYQQQQAFLRARQRLGVEALSALSGEAKAVVVLGKPYNLHDALANLGLARQLERLGLPAIPMDLLPLGDEVLSEEWYMLAWQLSREQVRALSYIATRPRLFPIHVSNYGCGPDAFTVKHLERAWGRRPMLLLEFDEHRGEAGLVTRLEAFADEIDSCLRDPAAPAALRIPEPRHNVDLPAGTRCVLPYVSAHVYPYAGALQHAGLTTRIMNPPDAETLRLGEEVASGRECHPYAIVAGDLARLVRTGDFEPGDRYFLPSTRLPCLLSQYGDGYRRLLEVLGEDRIQVFDQHPGEAVSMFGAKGIILLYEGLTLIDYLIVVGCLLRPREQTPGTVDGVLRDCFAMVEQRGAEGTSARDCLVQCSERLERVIIGPKQPRPIIGVTGDLYTRLNAAGNGSLFARLEAMGCSVWPSPFYAATSDFELPQNARRSRDRGNHVQALKQTALAALLRSRSTRLAAVLSPEWRDRCVEPPQSVLQAYAKQYVQAHSNHLIRGIVAKMADFAARGAHGVISAIGLGCMVGVTAAAAIPSIRRDYNGIPMVSIAYGGTEGPAQHIQLETFVHQVKQRFQK
jgi:predicted CoA-substrate-specific enzyme activase